MPVSKTSLAQDFLGLARRTAARRHGGVDVSARPDLHHPPRQPITVPDAVPPHLTVDRSAVPDTDTAARGLAMPRRTTTRAQTRAQAIDDERAYNVAVLRAEAEERERQQVENRESACEEGYFPAWPRPPGDDPPPF